MNRYQLLYRRVSIIPSISLLSSIEGDADAKRTLISLMGHRHALSTGGTTPRPYHSWGVPR